MQPQIISVHNIEESIKDVGVKPYANTIVQEMAGQYYYVEAECVDPQVPIESYRPGTVFELKDGHYKGYKQYIEHREVKTEDQYPDSTHKIETIDVYWRYKVWQIPLRLAWFIIDCLKLKAQATQLGSNEYRESQQAVYLTPGKEIFGKKIEKLTEIPAELMPVVVERL